MTAKDLYDKIYAKAEEFGLVPVNSSENPLVRSNESGNAVIRQVIEEPYFEKHSAFFGFIDRDENTTQGYSGWSWVIFPQADADKFVMSLQLGTADAIVKDRELLRKPGTRRCFVKLRGVSENSKTPLLTPAYKYDFLDSVSPQSEIEDAVQREDSLAGNGILNYLNTSVASVIIDSSKDAEMDVCYAWLAQYALLRKWPKRKSEIDAADAAIAKATYLPQSDHVENVLNELKRRHYVVLYGAPGVGKTYTANLVSKKDNFFSKTKLIQFHAETTYSDFVCGLVPDEKKSKRNLIFKKEKGILLEMIEEAKKVGSNGNVLLIIDEINRANLANVLGPVFYLFENDAAGRVNSVKLPFIEGGLTKLPDNLYVLATMNSTDRNIAVVDYALRRRFSWYMIPPEAIAEDEHHTFHSEAFKAMDSIFAMYADDTELALQPGPSYFYTKRENANDIFKSVLEYELKPLIKEYFAEGYLLEAKSALYNFFLKNGVILYA